MPLVSLRDVTVGFGGPPVLDEASLRIDPGERIGLVGRNGAGKSTLLRVISGEIASDRGEVARQQGLKVALLDQQVPQDLSGTIFDEVARGLGAGADLLADYHRASQEYAQAPGESQSATLERLQAELDHQGAWQLHQQAERILSRMELRGDVICADLSAGMKRRVLLARAMAGSPDLLLLDEPTNHLDLGAIEWLEEFLLRFAGGVVLVTHDRVFLRKLATRIVEVDRGRLTSWDCDHATYLARKEQALETEERQQALFDKRLAQEEVWIRTGIRARRTRNEGRVRALEDLREARLARRERVGEVRMQVTEAERSGRLVIEAQQATFGYAPEQPPIIRDLSLLVMRGDKVGIIGPNGSGKSTLLRLLLGECQPQSGSVRHGTRLEVSYFDQLHRQLDLEKSIIENVTDGSDRITSGGGTRHVIGYLEDFLFSPEQSRRSVKYLSGGERNRLLLARLFARPTNVLVMDEPTNDLDLETLELLEALLVDYQGTLLVVSHDREFLNHVVTSTLVLDGQGQVKEYAGAYDDWARQRALEQEAQLAARPKPASNEAPSAPESRRESSLEKPRKLSFKEQRELEGLLRAIGQLEEEQRVVHQTLADPAFYREGGSRIADTKARLAEIEEQLSRSYERWESLEQLR